MSTTPPSKGLPDDAHSAGGKQAESAPDSMTTVLIAFCANLAVALAKTVATVLTGSASMVAEAAHSRSSDHPACCARRGLLGTWCW